METKTYGRYLWTWNATSGAVSEYQVRHSPDEPKLLGYADNYFEFLDYTRERIGELKCKSTFLCGTIR